MNLKRIFFLQNMFKNNQLATTGKSLVSIIENEEFDSSFFVGTDPISHLPYFLSSNIAKKPFILVDNHNTATSQLAEVVLPTAITGIESAGLAYRLDQIPIELSKIINPPSNLPSDEELLTQIYELLNQGEAE